MISAVEVMKMTNSVGKIGAANMMLKIKRLIALTVRTTVKSCTERRCWAGASFISYEYNLS